jgi:EAL domain-containing protein (putative c-di-GMP-specific phosphodiesterase class I)
MLSGVQSTTYPTIGEILDAGGTVTHFQPILSARRKSIVGLEALSRGSFGPGDSPLIQPKTLFQLAAEGGAELRLEQACHQTAMRNFARLSDRPPDLVLFLNLSLSVMREHDSTAAVLREVVRAAGVSPRQVALEILEAEIEEMEQLRALTDSFRDAGFLLVLDDVGAGHSNLDRVPLIKPDMLKIDRCLISGVDRDYYKQETVKSLVGLAKKIGALVVAEGIETEEEAIVALELGADMLQGFHLAVPAAEASARGERLVAAVERMDAVAQRFKRHMVRKIHDRRLEHRRAHLIMTQIRDQLTKVTANRFDAVLTDMIGEFPDVECVYVLNEDGVQVTDAVGSRGASFHPAGIMFQPGRRGTDHSLNEYYYILLGVELPQYVTEPYVSLASGSIGRTISTSFRDTENRLCVLCIDVVRQGQKT